MPELAEGGQERLSVAKTYLDTLEQEPHCVGALMEETAIQGCIDALQLSRSFLRIRMAWVGGVPCIMAWATGWEGKAQDKEKLMSAGILLLKQLTELQIDELIDVTGVSKTILENTIKKVNSILFWD